jgi:hypothetical protein
VDFAVLNAVANNGDEKMNNTPQHCPGFERFRNLNSFICRCSDCGTEQEIFSDEFDRPRSCKKCHKPIDFTQCAFDVGTEESASV